MYQIIQTKVLKVKEAKEAKVRTPEDARDYCSDIADLSQESFQILTVNARNNVIDRHMITLGLADASLIHPREVYRACIKDGAMACILVHNHPSGDTTPSSEDIRITKQLIEAGKIIDIKPLDHIILAKQNGIVKVLSMRENGLCQF